MTDKNEYMEIANKLDEIFKPQGYTIIGFDPDFQMGHISGGGGGCLLKFSIAKRIVELYDSAKLYERMHDDAVWIDSGE